MELRPGPLTVLIGPNGSGKSNILDALKFLKEPSTADPSIRRYDVDRVTVGRTRRLTSQVVWGGQTDSKLKFRGRVLPQSIGASEIPQALADRDRKTGAADSPRYHDASHKARLAPRHGTIRYSIDGVEMQLNEYPFRAMADLNPLQIMAVLRLFS